MRLFTLVRCADKVRAHAIRGRLEVAGIDAVVTGDDAASSLSMGGAPTDSMVRVEVSESDRERAALILQEDESRMAGATEWTCSRCDEWNERSFDLCWSCSKQRSPNDRGETEVEQATVNPLVAESEITQRDSEDGNPYRPPSPPSITAPEDLFPANIDALETLESKVRRAWMGAIMGMVVLPPLLSLYSLYLCLGLTRSVFAESKCRVRWSVSLLINALSIPLWTMILTGQF